MPAPHGVTEPELSPETVARLLDLGVEVAAVGRKAVSKALRHARIKGARASLDAFAEDYLDTNARLGGKRCVTIREYAMHTEVDGEPLGDVLHCRLLQMEGIRVYRDTAFHSQRLPRSLRLPIADLGYGNLTLVHVPCMLHGDQCNNSMASTGTDQTGPSLATCAASTWAPASRSRAGSSTA